MSKWGHLNSQLSPLTPCWDSPSNSAWQASFNVSWCVLSGSSTTGYVILYPPLDVFFCLFFLPRFPSVFASTAAMLPVKLHHILDRCPSWCIKYRGEKSHPDSKWSVVQNHRHTCTYTDGLFILRQKNRNLITSQYKKMIYQKLYIMHLLNFNPNIIVLDALKVTAYHVVIHPASTHIHTMSDISMCVHISMCLLTVCYTDYLNDMLPVNIPLPNVCKWDQFLCTGIKGWKKKKMKKKCSECKLFYYTNFRTV